jgi:hypothetical protein
MTQSISEITQTSKGNNDLQHLQTLSPDMQQKAIVLRIKYPKLTDLCSDYNPDKAVFFSHYPTRCITGAAPTLIDINLSYHSTASLVWLIAHITSLQEQLNVPNKMTVYQIDACAQIITERYGYLKLSEIMLFFARLKGGLYNVDWHGYITPDKLVAALREYFIPYRNDLLHKIEKDRKEREQKKQRNAHDVMTHQEWIEIKIITAMYNSDYMVTQKDFESLKL